MSRSSAISMSSDRVAAPSSSRACSTLAGSSDTEAFVLAVQQSLPLVGGSVADVVAPKEHSASGALQPPAGREGLLTFSPISPMLAPLGGTEGDLMAKRTIAPVAAAAVLAMVGTLPWLGGAAQAAPLSVGCGGTRVADLRTAIT